MRKEVSKQRTRLIKVWNFQQPCSCLNTFSPRWFPMLICVTVPGGLYDLRSDIFPFIYITVCTPQFLRITHWTRFFQTWLWLKVLWSLTMSWGCCFRRSTGVRLRCKCVGVHAWYWCFPSWWTSSCNFSSLQQGRFEDSRLRRVAVQMSSLSSLLEFGVKDDADLYTKYRPLFPPFFARVFHGAGMVCETWILIRQSIWVLRILKWLRAIYKW